MPKRMHNGRLPIKYGRKVGYHYGNRLVDRVGGLITCNINVPGTLFSPHGKQWRPCGLYYPGILLINWDTGQQHTVDFRTLLRMAMLGWLWVPDSETLPKFKISRWPMGEHYYLLKPDGDPIGQDKYDTWDQAFNMGNLWAAKQTQKVDD